MEQVRGYCPLCISRCGSVSTVDAGRLVKVVPDPEHPTGKSFCIKGRTAPELVHSNRRLLYPMMRSRPKGDDDPGWRRVTWDEALTYAANGMQRAAAAHGPESVAFAVTTPSGTAVADAFGWIHRLAHAFGSPNVIFATENCNWHKDHAPRLTFGAPIGTPDFENAGCMLFWGFNPTTSWPAYAQAARDAKKRGARLIVVDPRRAGLAKIADQWLAVRPGADGALALAIAGVMIRKGWYDQDFIASWTNGPFLVRSDNGRFLVMDVSSDGASNGTLIAWDVERQELAAFDRGSAAYLNAPPQRPALSGEFAFSAREGALRCRPAFQYYTDLCERFPPERAAALTGVSAHQIEETARLLYEARPVSYYHWAGVCQQVNATQTGRAISLLYALTGSHGAPGGNVPFPAPPVNDISGLDLLAPAQLAKALGRDERPLGPPSKGWITSRDFAQAVLASNPYPVRGLVSFGSNPLLTKPHTPNLEPAMRALDFYIHADMFLNPSAQDADLVLPVASPWEREGLAPGFQLGERGSAWLQLRQPVLEPLGESRPDTEIVFELAKRLGLDTSFFDGDREAGLRHVLAPTGVSATELRLQPEGIGMKLNTRYRAYRDDGFQTPTRRLEVYSEQLLEIGLSPVPEYVPEPLPPNEDYPLRLTSAKSPYFCHSQHHALPSLRRKNPEPLAELHPDLARQKGIKEADWVIIQTPVGAMRARARITEGIAADAVCAQYGWWEPCPDLGLPGHGLAEANYNALIDDASYDSASGSNAMHGYPCSIWLANSLQPQT
jgi:anaerobic selenocysteine-containing dehydrogenase